MCIYIEYLWRETQETNDCRLPVGMRIWETDCSGVKTYFFVRLTFECIFLYLLNFLTIFMGYF